MNTYMNIYILRQFSLTVRWDFIGPPVLIEVFQFHRTSVSHDSREVFKTFRGNQIITVCYKCTYIYYIYIHLKQIVINKFKQIAFGLLVLDKKKCLSIFENLYMLLLSTIFHIPIIGIFISKIKQNVSTFFKTVSF